RRRRPYRLPGQGVAGQARHHDLRAARGNPLRLRPRGPASQGAARPHGALRRRGALPPSPLRQAGMTALPPEVSAFITRARVGRLATADATGQPLVLPICYAFDGRVLYSAVDAKPEPRRVADLAR